MCHDKADFDLKKLSLTLFSGIFGQEDICSTCSSSGFTNEPGVSFSGPDFDFYKNVQTAAQCSELCASEPDCVGFTIHPEGTCRKLRNLKIIEFLKIDLADAQLKKISIMTK